MQVKVVSNGSLCPEVVQKQVEFVGKVIVETRMYLCRRRMEWCKLVYNWYSTLVLFCLNNWCKTQYNGYCGIICNACNNSWQANAYGGDVNRDTVYSCVTFGIVIPNCNCPTQHLTALPQECLVNVAE